MNVELSDVQTDLFYELIWQRSLKQMKKEAQNKLLLLFKQVKQTQVRNGQKKKFIIVYIHRHRHSWTGIQTSNPQSKHLVNSAQELKTRERDRLLGNESYFIMCSERGHKNK